MRYKCCNILEENGIEFRYNGVSLCQRVDHVGGGDIVVQTYNDKTDKFFDFDINKFLAKRKEVIDQNKTGEIYHKCVGCVELYENDWSEIEQPKVSQIILHHWTKCNSHCIYCYTNTDKKYFNERNSYKVLPILKQIEKSDLLDYGGICSFAGGELSCLKEFKGIVKILDRNYWAIIFNSSCIKYERIVAEHLKKGSGMLIVSVDSGNRELHKKIKQTDSFNSVWKNIAKYAKAAKNHLNMIYTKYIVIKDINDNEKSITEFLEMSQKSGIKYVLMEIDHYYFCDNRENIPKYIVDLFYFAFNKAKELGLDCQIYSNSSVLLQQGKWADDFWSTHIFDAGREINKYQRVCIQKISKNGEVTLYDDIKSASKQNNLSYKDIWIACEKNKKKKEYILKENLFSYYTD